jgi:hypothetical protein
MISFTYAVFSYTNDVHCECTALILQMRVARENIVDESIDSVSSKPKLSSTESE